MKKGLFFLTCASTCLITIVFLTSASVAAIGTIENLNSSIQVIWRLAPKNYYEGIQFLLSNDYDIAGVNSRTGTIDIVTTRDDPHYDLNDHFTIVQETFVEAPTGDSEKYMNPDRVYEALMQLKKQYPNLAQVYKMGQSIEGRDILAIKISDNVKMMESREPAILFDGMHHAREVMTPEIPLDIAEFLLANYASDTHVKEWVDNLQIWIVPMLNVDGNNRVWTEDRMWRKNVRDGLGVDLNRNYPYRWGACGGSSGNPSNPTYRGTAEGSEPETQAMMKLMDLIRPVINLSFHSFGEWLIYPLGCNGEVASDENVILANELARLLPSDDGEGHYTPGTAWEVLYDVDGDSIDWAYTQYGTLSFVAEMNQDFAPNYDHFRDSTVAKFRPAWSFLLDKALEKRK